MDVTTAQRAHLSARLRDALGEEAAQTMMAHLPEGGSSRVATVDDIARLEAAIARCATKEDLAGFATKGDLQWFATKEDLARFATKEDLARFATKEDLARLPTKEDLEGLLTVGEAIERFPTREEFRELRGDVHGIARDVRELRSDVAAALSQGDRLRAEWREDLVTSIGRQTLVQVGSILTIIIAALVFATQFGG